MAKFEITAPDGSKWEIQAPEGASEAEVLSFARSQWSAQEKPDTNYLQGITRSATQGTTLGFADEVEAAGGATAGAIIEAVKGNGWNWGGEYEKELDRIRREQGAFTDENPGAALAANLIGGLATAGPAASRAVLGASSAAAVPAGGVGAKIARGAAAGGGIGAVSGFGNAEGGVGERLVGAGVGAAAGTTVGAVMPPVTALLSKAAAPAWRAISDRIGKNAPKVEERKVLEALMRDFDTDSPNAAVARAAARLRTLGPEATLADVGENSRALLGAAVNKPGPVKQKATRLLETRQRMQGDRIKASADNALGTGERYYQTLDDLNTARRTAAAPLYEQAYQAQFVSSPRLDDLMTRPSMKQALSRAYRIAAEEGRDPKGLGLDFNEAGDVVFTSRPSMQTMDYVKRGIDDVVEGFRDPVTGRLRLDESGRAIDATRAALREELDNLNPVYAQARAAWGGPTEMMDAMARGRDFFRPDAEITENVVARMSPSEREAFVVGVRRGIEDLMDRVPSTADAVKRLINTPARQKALKAAFPDDKSYRRFVADLLREGQFNKTRNMALTGSPTQPRNMAEQDMQTDPGAIVGLLAGDPIQGGRGLLQMLPGALRGELPDATRAGIGSLLMGNDLSRLTQRAQMAKLDDTAKAALRSGLIGTLSYGGGLLSAGP